MNAARAQLKEGMAAVDGDKSLEERIELLNGIAVYLKRNIVQGKKQDDGKYFLNIHEESELGDNESIKKPKSTLGDPAAPAGGCCGGGQKVMTERRSTK